MHTLLGKIDLFSCLLSPVPVHRLQEQVSQCEAALEQLSTRLSSLTQKQAALEEANKALGAEGVQSYVLEGVLVNLQML